MLSVLEAHEIDLTVAHALSESACALSQQFPPRESESEDERTDDIYRQLGEKHRNSTSGTKTRKA
jgi:hypothetical protein